MLHVFTTPTTTIDSREILQEMVWFKHAVKYLENSRAYSKHVYWAYTTLIKKENACTVVHCPEQNLISHHKPENDGLKLATVVELQLTGCNY